MRPSTLALRRLSTMLRTVGVRAPRTYATTSVGAISANSPPTVKVSTALEGTDGSRPMRKYKPASPTSETKTATPSNVNTMTSPRLAMSLLSGASRTGARGALVHGLLTSLCSAGAGVLRRHDARRQTRRDPTLKPTGRPSPRALPLLHAAVVVK